MSLRIPFEKDNIKHICLLSGGHSSAIVSIEVHRKYGKENCVLVNHDIHPDYEDKDIKRFKNEISDYLQNPITYVNYMGLPVDKLPDQFDIANLKKGFKSPDSGDAFCTYELKTKPFMDWMVKEFPFQNVVIYYGFDKNEKDRIVKRQFVLGLDGYDCEFPLAHWSNRTIHSTLEIGIVPPLTYALMSHANCIGCLKAGQKHWYVVYCTRQDVWEKGKKTESERGYSILKSSITVDGKKTSRPLFLTELEPVFERMKRGGVSATEKMSTHEFTKMKKKFKCPDEWDAHKPCECFV
jgi:hypothetical protein